MAMPNLGFEESTVKDWSQIVKSGKPEEVYFYDFESSATLIISVNQDDAQLDFSTSDIDVVACISDFQRMVNRISFVTLFDQFVEWSNSLEGSCPRIINIRNTNRYFLIFLNNLFLSVSGNPESNAFHYASPNSATINMRMLLPQIQVLKLCRNNMKYENYPMYLRLLADSGTLGYYGGD